jgi:hypothetical protein
MPVFYDLTKDIRFKEGVKKGEEQKARASYPHAQTRRMVY